NSCCQLPFRGGEDFAAADEMQVEAGHLAQGEKMIVPLFRRGGGYGDFFRPGTADGDEFARPPQRLERLVPRAGARFRMNFRSFARRLDDRNAELVNPGGDVTRARD